MDEWGLINLEAMRNCQKSISNKIFWAIYHTIFYWEIEGRAHNMGFCKSWA